MGSVAQGTVGRGSSAYLPRHDQGAPSSTQWVGTRSPLPFLRACYAIRPLGLFGTPEMAGVREDIHDVVLECEGIAAIRNYWIAKLLALSDRHQELDWACIGESARPGLGAADCQSAPPHLRDLGTTPQVSQRHHQALLQGMQGQSGYLW